MSQVRQTLSYLKPGTYTFTVPPGVSGAEIFLWGAGGASGATGASTRYVTGQAVVGSTTTIVDVPSEVTIPGTPGYVIPGGSRTVTQSGVVSLPPGITSATVTATGGTGATYTVR